MLLPLHAVPSTLRRRGGGGQVGSECDRGLFDNTLVALLSLARERGCYGNQGASIHEQLLPDNVGSSYLTTRALARALLALVVRRRTALERSRVRLAGNEIGRW